MVETLGLVVLGFFVGLYGTLVGIGGGPLIVPAITMLFDYDTPTVIATALFVIFFNTVSGSIAYVKENRVDLVSGTKFGLATIPGSLVSTFAVYYIHIDIFTSYFGIFLIGLAAYIFLKPVESKVFQAAPVLAGFGRTTARKRLPLRGSSYSRRLGIEDLDSEEWDVTEEKNSVQRVIRDSLGNVYNYRVNERLGMVATALIGVFSTFLGIGGGLIQVPVLVYLLSFPVHVATATSHYVTAINTCFTLIPFMVNNDIAYKPAVTLAFAAVVGAQLGARISNRILGKTLLRFLIPVFLFMGIKLLFFG
jgi:hypothetical protein